MRETEPFVSDMGMKKRRTDSSSKRFVALILLVVLFFSLRNMRLRQRDEELFSVVYEETVTPEQLNEINQLRPDFDLGTCRTLMGDISIVLFFMDDFQSNWTEKEIESFVLNDVEPGLKFLEEEAGRRGIGLNFCIKKVCSSLMYDGEVILSIKDTGLATTDVLYQAARSLHYSSDEEMLADYKKQYGTEVVCYTIFNKNGTSYAINPPRGDTTKVEEHCIVFKYDLTSDRDDPIGAQASIISHELLHLYGAEDYYAPASRKRLAQKHWPSDIMLKVKYDIADNNLGNATAFYVGWTNRVPEAMQNDGWNGSF